MWSSVSRRFESLTFKNRTRPLAHRSGGIGAHNIGLVAGDEAVSFSGVIAGRVFAVGVAVASETCWKTLGG